MPAGGQVSVAIPVRDGGAVFGDMIDAVISQRLDRPVEVVVADSGSTDGRRELAEFFDATAPDGQPRVDRGLRPEDRRPGPVTFYTDANGCLSRRAWERVPYRHVTYAEDQLLALDMLAAGFAKVFRPRAAV